MEPSPAENMLTSANLSGRLERIVRQVEARIDIVNDLTAELTRISNRVDPIIARLEPERDRLKIQRDQLIEEITFVKAKTAPLDRKLELLTDMYNRMYERNYGIKLGSTSKGSSSKDNS